nr:MAG: Putative binding domain, N-terminal [Bacteriophage sp.]
MKKEFITFSPDSGQGDGQVTLTADPNFTASERWLYFSTKADFLNEIVKVIQEGVPFYTSGMFKYSVYPKDIRQLDFIPTLKVVTFGVNDDQYKTKYPDYFYAIERNDSNYDFSSDIKYYLIVSIRSGLIDGKYDLKLETPNNSVYLKPIAKLGKLKLDNYEGEIFLSNGTSIVSEISLKLTNKNDASDYVTLFKLSFYFYS